jgi:RHS repeat-associated protein
LIKGVFAINFKRLLLFGLISVYFFTSTFSTALAATNYTYDANGNATTDGKYCYQYNDANQLKRVTICSSGQVVADYIYDFNGNRIEKKIYSNGSLQKTVYSPNDMFEATKQASNGAVTNTSYYFVNDELAAKKNSDGSKNYFLNDHLGSIGYLTNSSGTVLETTQYYPYGLVRAGGTKNKFLYTGQENDPETGLDYYNFRYYSPQLGRFIQPDNQLQTPYDPQSLNNYSYVKNNPIKYTDPTGHWAEILAPLAIYFNQVATAPDINFDLQFLAMAAADFSQNQNVDTSINLGLSALSVAVPGVSLSEVRALKEIRSGNIRIEGHVTERMAERGWSSRSIKETVAKSKYTINSQDTRKFTGGKPSLDPVKVFYSNDKKGYVAVNLKTKEVIALSDRNKFATWKTTWKVPWKVPWKK